MKAFYCEIALCYAFHSNHEWWEGLWNGEPDRVDWNWFGLRCFVHRNVRRHTQWGGTGNFNGYVAVPRSHPAFNRHYDALEVSVHGGLTYGSRAHDHLGFPDRAKHWVFGFDCAHAGDYSPALEVHTAQIMGREPRLPGEKWPKKDWDHYWSLQEVIAETKLLAEQLARMTHHHIRTRNDTDWIDPWKPTGEKGRIKLHKSIRRSMREPQKPRFE